MKKTAAFVLRCTAGVSYALAFVVFFVALKGTLGEVKAPKDFK